LLSYNYVIVLFTKDKKLEQHFAKVLSKKGYKFISYSTYEELFEGLKEGLIKTLFLHDKSIDNDPSIYKDIKQLCPSCQIVLFYEKGNGLVRDAIRCGVYACIKAPYSEWEILTIFHHLGYH